MSNVLELKDIKQSYKQGTTVVDVLRGASLTVKKGEIVSLLGPSGSGKSTLLHIAGLLEKQNRGEVLIEEHNCTRLHDNKRTSLRLNHIGFVYQQYNLLSDFTALENVMMPLLIKGEKKNRAEGEAEMYLGKLGLSHRIHHRPSELSGGEQQRVAVARALINKPKILLADEPTGNLDPATSDKVFKEFLTLVRNEGLSALIATHNSTLASKMDRKVALVDGKLVNISRPI